VQGNKEDQRAELRRLRSPAIESPSGVRIRTKQPLDEGGLPARECPSLHTLSTERLQSLRCA
jgi:hypothetical protein